MRRCLRLRSLLLACCAALGTLASAAPAAAQSDDPCLDALADDSETLDRYDALVSEYLDASAASDSARQVEVLDELIGICQANLRLYAFRANAKVAMDRCNAAEVDYRHVLDNAESWPHEANASDARALAVKGLDRANEVCGTDTTNPAGTGGTADGAAGTPDATTGGQPGDATATGTTGAPPAATAGVPAAEPADAAALVLGLSVGGGVAWAGVDGGDGGVGIESDPVRGVGGGGQFFATYQFVDWFGIGGTVRFNVFRHDSSDDDGATRTSFIPSFAPLVRFRTEHFVANVWIGLFVGTLEIETELDDGSTASTALDLTGLEVGSFLGYPFEPWSSGTLELGALLGFRNGTASQSEDGFLGFDVTTFEADFSAFDLALALQGTFEIGL